MNLNGGFFDDFVGAKVSGSILHSRIPWVITGTGSPTVSVLAGDSGAPGRVSLTCSSSVGDECILRTQSPIMLSDVAHFMASLTYVTGNSNGYAAAGLAVTPAYGMSEGLYFLHDSGLDSNWHSVARNGAGSSQSHTDTLATTIQTAFRGLVHSDQSYHAECYNPLTGALVEAFHHQAQLPAASALVYPCIVLSNTTATSKTVIVDFFGLGLRQINRIPGMA